MYFLGIDRLGIEDFINGFRQFMDLFNDAIVIVNKVIVFVVNGHHALSAFIVSDLFFGPVMDGLEFFEDRVWFFRHRLFIG